MSVPKPVYPNSINRGHELLPRTCLAKRQKKLQDALDKFSAADTLSTLQNQFLAKVFGAKTNLGFIPGHTLNIFGGDTHPCLQDEGEDPRRHQQPADCE